MQQCRLRLVQSVGQVLSTASAIAPFTAAAVHSCSTAAFTVLATGRCTRVAPVTTLAALQNLNTQRTVLSGPLNAASVQPSCSGASSTKILPTLPAVCQRLVHRRAAVAEPAASATSAATRHPLPPFTADEGLTAAAAETTQLDVAAADSPAAAHPGSAGSPAPEDRASAAEGSRHTGEVRKADGDATAPSAEKRNPARRRARKKASTEPRPWRPNSRLPHVDYTPAVETEVLDFWRRRGLLLPEGSITDAAVAGEQQQLRRRVLKFAQKSSHHRDVPQLEQRMARWDAAKEAESWPGDVNRQAIADIRALGRDPFTQLGKLKRITEMFSRYGISMHPTPSTFQLLSFRVETLETAVPKFLEAARSWNISFDPAVLLQKVPTLLQCADFSTHTGRVAALRKLHPQLDIGKVLWGAPGVLKLREATIQQQWDGLRDAAELDVDQMRTLVEYSSSVMKRRPETLRRRLQDVRRFDEARAAAGLPPPPQFKFPAWLSNMLAKSQHRFLRLTFLLDQAKGGHEAALAQPALTVIEHPDLRFNKLWPGFSAWCVRHMAADDGSGNASDGDSGLISASKSAASRRRGHSDSSGSDSE